MISRSNVEAAWGLIRLHVRRTPVIELSAGSLGVTAPLALKLQIVAGQRLVQGTRRIP